jgi:hypothetical protein
MNTKYFSPATLVALLLSAITTSISTAHVGFAAAAATTSSQHDSYSGSKSQEVMRNFQLGNHSYELTRYSQYDYYHGCFGHQARHAESIMDNIERVCGEISELSYPAQNPVAMLLREGNYFDCGRDQLRVDLIDKNDAGQQCAVGFINANGKVWVNGARATDRKELALLGLAMAVVAFAMLGETL